MVTKLEVEDSSGNAHAIDLSSNVDTVLAAVEAAGDPEVAAAVHEAEAARKRPRKTLLAGLADLQETASPQGAASPEPEPEGPPTPGTPTEPDRGGLAAAERAAFAPQGPPAAAQGSRRSGPSITGSLNPDTGAGVPTEPDRGGLNDLERELHGVT